MRMRRISAFNWSPFSGRDCVWKFLVEELLSEETNSIVETN